MPEAIGVPDWAARVRFATGRMPATRSAAINTTACGRMAAILSLDRRRAEIESDGVAAVGRTIEFDRLRHRLRRAGRWIARGAAMLCLLGPPAIARDDDAIPLAL